MLEGLVYLDTNIYSDLAKRFSPSQGMELRDSLLANGKKPILSPVNVLEILSTRDSLLREKIIFFCQHFCVPEILAEPEALIVDFICTEFPQEATKCFVKENQIGNSSLSRAWLDIQKNKQKTFLLPEADRVKIDYFKIFHSYLHAFYSRGHRLSNFRMPSPEGCSNLDSYQKLIKVETRKLRETKVPEERIAILCENRKLATLVLICSCLSPFPDSLERYWNKLGKNKVLDRLEYVEKNLGFIDESGPIVAIGSFMGWQATKRHDNGNFYDCLHLMYLPYVSKFYTNDPAFNQFRQAYPQAKLLKNILSGDELFA